jgi:hypothetical protein
MLFRMNFIEPVSVNLERFQRKENTEVASLYLLEQLLNLLNQRFPIQIRC